MITIRPDKRLKEFQKFMENLESRAVDGMEYVVLESAKILYDEIISKNPDVQGVDYLKGLKVSLVSTASLEAAVCVYYDSDTRVMEEGDEEGLLFFEPGPKAEDADYMLAKYQPWPTGMLPFEPSGAVKTIFREATSFEIQEVTKALQSNASQIETAFSAVGKTVNLESPRGAQGIEVTNDLTYSVMRTEYGVFVKAQPHWRPGVKAVGQRVRKLGEKFVEYVINGKESVWDLPDYDMIPESYLEDEGSFQKKIARGSGVKSGY